ncbi:hypothetical protein BN1058_00477 [Paraliobacillus sp. PM-2]|uniref:hypothetical protein n=1 Tax=Paraliobacillus sp. PM-2 TaxID=1462524 RepID=UPI00061C86F8|nr:hypothetical protein [Paraliobacillus sp. PM-2]CQR46224.1 hypothetical protein BN1058_00477 [Paraliobacillus sp. PM-2]
MYENHLTLEELEHSDQLFISYMNENDLNKSNDHGVYNYTDGEVHCNVHSDNELPEKDEGESVPIL